MNKIDALALYLGVDVGELEVTTYDDSRFETNGEEYWVLTDSEADQAWEESLDNYLEECIYPELPVMARNYFDDEKWKRAARHDGRGHSLSSYDGEEHEVRDEDGSFLFIYRVG